MAWRAGLSRPLRRVYRGTVQGVRHDFRCLARSVAVGGRVTPLPPAQIPACAANAPGSCRRSDVIGLRGLGGPYSSDPWARGFGDMPIPALCPGHA